LWKGSLSVSCRRAVSSGKIRDRKIAKLKTELRNAALAAAAANPEILPLELLLGDHPFMDR
jgi:hypothetical protein